MPIEIDVLRRALRGDHCPGCLKGKIYGHQPPARLVRLIGHVPITATVYELEKLRCNLCGEIFTAEAPPEVGPEKYDATAASMIAVLKYGAGVPFARLAGLQRRVEIPLPEATQWEIVHEVAIVIQPAFQELLRQAAQGDVVNNDDTACPSWRCGVSASTAGRRLYVRDRVDERWTPDRTLLHGTQPCGRKLSHGLGTPRLRSRRRSRCGHQLPSTHRVTAKPILGGLHHEYRLEAVAA